VVNELFLGINRWLWRMYLSIVFKSTSLDKVCVWSSLQLQQPCAITSSHIHLTALRISHSYQRVCTTTEGLFFVGSWPSSQSASTVLKGRKPNRCSISLGRVYELNSVKIQEESCLRVMNLHDLDAEVIPTLRLIETEEKSLLLKWIFFKYMVDKRYLFNHRP